MKKQRKIYLCTVPGCSRERKERGLCKPHALRRELGLPLDTPIVMWACGRGGLR